MNIQNHIDAEELKRVISSAIRNKSVGANVHRGVTFAEGDFTSR